MEREREGKTAKLFNFESQKKKKKMSATGRGKRKDDGDEVGSDDGGDAAPPKKAAKRDANESDESDDVVVCEISKNRRVSVRSWNGRIFVDIREFYLKDGKQLPGKKGVYLFFFFKGF